MAEITAPANQPTRTRLPRVLWVLPVAAIVLVGLVCYRQFRPPRSPVSPDVLAATVRPVPYFYQLYDQHSRLVRLQAFVSRHKLLVVFVKTPGKRATEASGTKPSTTAQVAGKIAEPQESPLLQTIRRDYAKIQETGAILHVISDTTPWNNRLKEDREQRFPFSILSDLDGSTYRGWNAYDTRTQENLEAVCVVDRKGFITRTFLGPDHLGTPDDWVAALK